jgi:hypothetical protein
MKTFNSSLAIIAFALSTTAVALPSQQQDRFFTQALDQQQSVAADGTERTAGGRALAADGSERTEYWPDVWHERPTLLQTKKKPA